jgi:hypothetical protein
MLREPMLERLGEELLRVGLVPTAGASLDVGLDGFPLFGGELPTLEGKEERAHIVAGHGVAFLA